MPVKKINLSEPIGGSKWWLIGIVIGSFAFVLPICAIFLFLYFFEGSIAFLYVAILFPLSMVFVVGFSLLIMVVLAGRIKKKVNLTQIAGHIGAQLHLASWSRPFVTPALIGMRDGINYRLTLSRVVRRTALEAIADQTIRSDVVAAGILNAGSEWKIPTGSYMSWIMEIENNSGLEGGFSTRLPVSEKAVSLFRTKYVSSEDDDFERLFMTTARNEKTEERFARLLKDEATRNQIISLLSVAKPYASSISVLKDRVSYRFIFTEGLSIVSIWDQYFSFCQRYLR